MNDFENNLFDSLRDITSQLERIEETIEEIKASICALHKDVNSIKESADI